MELPVVQPARLPALASRWIVEALGTLPPAQTYSTCDACVKLPRPGEAMGEDHYHPDTKCCTYLPSLYNFQVGAILDDPEVAGRASVEARIAAGVGVTPQGLEGLTFFDWVDQRGRFGRDPAMRCPH